MDVRGFMKFPFDSRSSNGHPKLTPSLSVVLTFSCYSRSGFLFEFQFAHNNQHCLFVFVFVRNIQINRI